MTHHIKRSFKKTSYYEISEFAELNLPKDNCQIRFITNKSRSTIDLIEFIIAKYIVQEVFIANSAIDTKSLLRIKAIINSGFKNIFILMNSSLQKKKSRLADELLKLPNTKLHMIHTKIVLIKTKDNYFVLEGSGNISTNEVVEQYCLSNCENSYFFHKNWILNVKENI